MSLSELFADIASAIRNRNGGSAKYYPNQMADAIRSIQTKADATYQSKEATPTKSSQTITPDTGYDGLESVTVNPIPAAYIQPTGTVDITENGTVNVTQYASAKVNVPTGGGTTINNQDKTVTPSKNTQPVTADAGYTGLGTVTVKPIPDEYIIPSMQTKAASPTESEQTISPDTGYDGLSSVTVEAISSTYVGSGITRDPTPTASGATVTIPAGYYSSQETKSVSTTTHPKPTASVNSSTGLVTASHTQTEGYVPAGTTTDTLQLTTQAAKTVTPTKSQQTAVGAGKYTTGDVTVAAIPDEYIVPSGSTTITDNGTTDVTAYASVEVAVPFVTYYTGTSAPTASLGSNGDIYLKEV